MVKTLKASEIYASQLVHLGYGHPLWYPEPMQEGEILIGDVGYIDDGCFIRLFNARRSQSDTVNRNSVPDGFVPLQLPDELVREQVDLVKPGESLCSDSVRKTEIKVNLESPTSPVSVSGGYSFTSSGKRGAVAILKDGGTERKVSRSTAFQRYIYTHHRAWHAFARRRGVHVRVQDLVLVSGFVKTAEFALAAYDDRDAAHEFNIAVNASSVFSAESSFSLAEQTHVGLRHRVGPRSRSERSPAPAPASPASPTDEKRVQPRSRTTRSPTSPADSVKSDKPKRSPKPPARPQDQCVFLQYYKCRPRGLGLTTLRMPQNLKPKDVMDSVGDECFCAPLDGFVDWVKRVFGGCHRDVEGKKETPRSTENPVSALLDYISKTSEADVAVTSHTDLYDLFPQGSEWPAKISSYLKEKRPRVTTDENGAARLNVDALPTPPPVPEKALPPVPSPPASPSTPTRSSPPRHDSTDDADPLLPGAWRNSSRRKTLLAPLDVRPARLHAVESIDSRLGTPVPSSKSQGAHGPPLRTQASARSQGSRSPASWTR